VGLTVSASIPLAVISIALFRVFSFFGLRDATILENNIVQTAGSAGESIAFGISVTMPAIMILGSDLHMLNVIMVGVIGGLLGILLMIPLRRELIVNSHEELKYPEGTACAEILVAGATTAPHNHWSSRTSPVERQAEGSVSGHLNPKTLFVGFITGFLYQTLMVSGRLWKDTPEKVFGAPLQGGSVSAEISPMLLGIGYIIGPRIASIMCAGGVLAYLVLIPAIKFFGEGVSTVLLPGNIPIAEMGPNQIRGAYVIYIGSGAVLTGGLINALRSLPAIFAAAMSVRSRLSASADAQAAPRTEHDIPKKIIIIGIVLLASMSIIFPPLQINFLGMCLMLFFSFLFVRVSGRITGELGSSANPVSGMTVASLLLVCVVFFFIGWTLPVYYVAALSIGAIVCVAVSNGGTTSQVLKTGYLVGATPRNQQIALLIGTLFSALVLGYVLVLLNDSHTLYIPRVAFEKLDKVDDTIHISTAELTPLKKYEAETEPPEPGQYLVLNVYSNQANTTGLGVGEYLVDELSGRVVYRIKHNFDWLRVDISNLTTTEKPRGYGSDIDANSYRVWSGEVSGRTGKYLVDNQGIAVYLVDPGINGIYRKLGNGPSVEKFDAPKAALMAYVIKGVLNQNLPWGLILLGVMLAITLELAGIPSLPFAVGLYLPLSSSSPIFIGGIIWWLSEGKKRSKIEDELENPVERGQGMMLSSGLIAGASVAGIIIAFTTGLFAQVDATMVEWSKANPFFEGPNSNELSLMVFMLLVGFLYMVGRGLLFADTRRKRI
jgi:putative OPT family oligopeptide transporter